MVRSASALTVRSGGVEMGARVVATSGGRVVDGGADCGSTVALTDPRRAVWNEPTTLAMRKLKSGG
eukprot:3450835-Pleurochrysis_carterae.AAC.1